jgi:ABC-type lipoprotein export system ATPase subunit
MSKDSDILIDMHNVDKRFNTEGGLVQAIRNANFSIPEGSFTVVYGPSGSGKTTLLNMLTGLDPPTSGEILYKDKRLSGMSSDERAHFRASTMGMVHQASHWVKSLSVVNNVALPLYFLGQGEEEASTNALSVLKKLGVESHAHKYPTVLSGGEQQRVSMARALVNNPTLILADEPTGNLDKDNGDLIISLLLSLNKNYGRTIILVTHNIEYLSLGDQLLMIEDGVVSTVKKEDIERTTSKIVSNVKNRMHDWSRHD